MKHLISLVAFSALAASAPAAIVLSSGHADISVNYLIPGYNWDLSAYDDGTDTFYAPSEVIFEVGAAAFGLLPNDPAFGAFAGAAAFTLPEVDNPALLALGWDAGALRTGIFIDDVVTVSLLSVSGPGSFFLWKEDGFGGFDIRMSGGTGLIELNAGAHDHYNLSFTAAGSYSLTLQGSGTLLPMHEAGFISDSAVYSFEVVPEPGTWALIAGAVALAIAIRRRR
jgi:hypothetical protein